MPLFTVKVSQYSYFYDVKASSKEEAENIVVDYPWDDVDENYSLIIEAEETDDY